MRRPRRPAALARGAALGTGADDITTEEVRAVRFEAGDLDADSPALSEEQIEYALETEGSTRGAAAACLESLSRRYAQLADVSTGDLRVSYAGRSSALAKRAEELRERAAGTSAAPFAGGISRSDKAARREAGDRVQPQFRRRQFDDHRPG